MPKLLEDLTREQVLGVFAGCQEPIVWSRREDENQTSNVEDEEKVEEGPGTESQAEAGHSHSVPPLGNAEPASMDNEDVFMDDDAFFVDLEPKAEADVQEAGGMNQSEEPLEVEPICYAAAAAQISVDGVDVESDNELERENLRFKVNESFSTMKDFRLAVRQYGIVRGFKVHKVRTDKTRYRAECKAERCPWRIVARKLRDQPTVVVLLFFLRKCCGTTLTCLACLICFFFLTLSEFVLCIVFFRLPWYQKSIIVCLLVNLVIQWHLKNGLQRELLVG
jgi:hypothetical protein